MLKKQTKIPVYLHGQKRGRPYMHVSVEDAEGWVKDRVARWMNKKGQSIVLYARKALKLRDRSCGWQPWFMELVVAGEPTAKEAMKFMEKRRWAV